MHRNALTTFNSAPLGRHRGDRAGNPLKGVSQTPQEFPRHRLDADLAELAGRVQRLTVSHRDPERFHIEKSEIAHDLRRLAEDLR